MCRRTWFAQDGRAKITLTASLEGYWFYNRRDPDWVRMHISNVR